MKIYNSLEGLGKNTHVLYVHTHWQPQQLRQLYIHVHVHMEMVHMGGESWCTVKGLQPPFPALKVGHVDHLLS